MRVVWCASRTSARERMVASQSSEIAAASRKAPARSTRASALAIGFVMEKRREMLTRELPRSTHPCRITAVPRPPSGLQHRKCRGPFTTADVWLARRLASGGDEVHGVGLELPIRGHDV